MLHKERSFLKRKSLESFFLGYSEESKADMLYDLEAKKIIVSQDVVFAEQPHAMDKAKMSTFSNKEVTHHVPSHRQKN